MASLNKNFLLGNLTQNPDCRRTPDGRYVCSFYIAINEGTRENPVVTFVKIEVWGSTAETCGRCLKKGSGVMIEGRLHLDSWEDRQTGQKRQQLIVRAQSVQFMSRPRTDGEQDEDNYSGYQQQQQPRRASRGVDPGCDYAQPPMPPEDDDGDIAF